MRMAVSMLGEGNNDVWSMNNSEKQDQSREATLGVA